MFEIIGKLEESGLAIAIEVQDLVDEDDINYLKMKAALKDGGLLFVTELIKADQNRYSYHWQDSSGRLIARWDNSPHHKNIETYPHHLHSGGRIKPSYKPSSDEIIDYLRKKIRG